MGSSFLASLALSFCLLFSICPAVSVATERPNMIFIFADDWGWEDLSCHGSPFVKTPNIDRLATEGRDFTRFTVASPVCSPSRTAVMTGQFPSRHSVDGHFAWVDSNGKRGMPDWLSTEAPSLPRILQSAGYMTGHYGKWHLSNEMIPDSPTPLEYGYDAYGAFNCSGEQMPYDWDVRYSIDFIGRAVAEDKPFFINLWLHEPHTPFHVLPKFRQMFPHLENDGENIYAATLAYADHRVGQLLDFLDENDLADDTLVIFSSDNGPAGSGKGDEVPKMSWDPSTGMGFGVRAAKGTVGGRKGRKGSLYEGGLNVPFLVRWPSKIEAGTTDDQSFITAVDLLPTFCNLAGAELPAGYVSDGLDYTKVLLGTPAPERSKPFFSRYKDSITAYSRGYKYHSTPKTNKVELYHLAKDPLEQTDIAVANPEVVAQIETEVEAWLESIPTEPTGEVFSGLRNDPEALQKTKEPYHRYKQ